LRGSAGVARLGGLDDLHVIEPGDTNDPPEEPRRHMVRDKGKWWAWTPEETHERLEGWPMLRQWFSEPWFGVACATCLLCLFLILAACLPVWRVNDPKAPAAVRLTLVDAVDATSKGKEAAEADRKGMWRTAAALWRVALGFNPVHEDSLRGALKNGLSDPANSRDRRIEMLRNALIFLNVAHTNTESLDLLAETFANFASDRLLLDITAGLTNQNRLSISIARAKALYSTARWEEFDREAAALGADGVKDPALPLYVTARAAAGPDAAKADEALANLRNAAANATTRPLALRLLLSVSYQRKDIDGYRETLGQLSDMRLNRVRDHLRLWMMLEKRGRREEAAQLARDFNRPPEDADELDELVGAYVHFDLEAEADALMDHFAVKIPASPECWMGYAEYLLAHRRWTELRSICGKMRSTTQAYGSLAGFSVAMEAIQAAQRGSPDEAREIANRAAELPIRSDRVAIHTAERLLEEGLPKPALVILKGRKSLQRDPDYWTMLLRAARGSDDAETLVTAARGRLAASPESAAAQMDLCAALLSAGLAPEEALTMGRRVIAASPGHPGVRLNYAMALEEMHEPAKALTMLQGLSTNDIAAGDWSAYALTLARAEADTGRLDAAAEHIAGIRDGDLMKAQRERLERLRHKIRQELGKR
jgi:hypothetical protein